MTVEDLVLENGCAAHAEGRSVMSETGLPADTQIEFYEARSRQTGTGYSNSLYRIVGTDDLLTIYHNDGPMDNLSWDNVSLSKGFFRKQKEYGKRVGKLSRKYHIPFEVCLALGDNEEIYPRVLSIIGGKLNVNACTLHDLRAGINRRKDALLSILGSELYETLGIGSMGQLNSERLARFVLKHCEQQLNR